MNDLELCTYFNENSLSYELFSHKPVFSAEDDCKEMKSIAGGHSKNLFLKDKKKNYLLVSIMDHKKVDLKKLSEQLGRKRFSFGNPAELLELIGVLPGSVTPFGLVHDKEKRVAYFLDEDFMKYELLNFHPLRNDQTISMQRSSFFRFFELIEHEPQLISIPER